MIVDTSAILAIMYAEPDAADYAAAIEKAPVRRLSAATYVEAAAVLDGADDPIVSRRFDEFLAEADISIEPVNEAQAEIARAAYRDFGKGRGHPAQLNFGDCFSYALAKVADERLLFKGDDFSKTDIRSALDNVR